MAKFCGNVGYVESSVETVPGVYEEVVTERKHYGDLLRNYRRLEDGTKVNNDLTISNSISIMADAYANTHFFAIRYVIWAGQYWTVSNVEVQTPRLILRLGEVYRGPKADAPIPA